MPGIREGVVIHRHMCEGAEETNYGGIVHRVDFGDSLVTSVATTLHNLEASVSCTTRPSPLQKPHSSNPSCVNSLP